MEQVLIGDKYYEIEDFGDNSYVIRDDYGELYVSKSLVDSAMQNGEKLNVSLVCCFPGIGEKTDTSMLPLEKEFISNVSSDYALYKSYYSYHKKYPEYNVIENADSLLNGINIDVDKVGIATASGSGATGFYQLDGYMENHPDVLVTGMLISDGYAIQQDVIDSGKEFFYIKNEEVPIYYLAPDLTLNGSAYEDYHRECELYDSPTSKQVSSLTSLGFNIIKVIVTDYTAIGGHAKVPVRAYEDGWIKYILGLSAFNNQTDNQTLRYIFTGNDNFDDKNAARIQKQQSSTTLKNLSFNINTLLNNFASLILKATRNYNYVKCNSKFVNLYVQNMVASISQLNSIHEYSNADDLTDLSTTINETIRYYNIYVTNLSKSINNMCNSADKIANSYVEMDKTLQENI